MNQWKRRARQKSVAAAALMVLAGGLFGIVVDRLWLLPRAAQAMPLTAQAMVARLQLEPSEEAQIRTLLDSIHAEVMTAAEHGPDSLVATARNAHGRLEAVLSPEARAEFRVWMEEHHRQMMERISRPTHEPGGSGSHHDDR